MLTPGVQGLPKGKGPKGRDWAGVYPATVIPFKDKTCREVDEAAYRALLRDILKAGVTGIDPNEAESLSVKETVRLMEIAREESGGNMPISGKVEARCERWVWNLVEEARPIVDAGADFLYLHPTPEKDNFLEYVNLFKMFDKMVGVPFMALMSPHNVPVPVMKQIAIECENLAAFKCFMAYNFWDLKRLVAALKDAEAETGRHVCVLLAGDHGLAEALINGAEGNFNGGASWRADADASIYRAVKAGDYNKAFAIQNKIQPASDGVRGLFGADLRPAGYFTLRFKLASWLLGKVPNPYARLPRLLLAEEALLMRDLLIKSGLEVVRSEAECRKLEMSDYHAESLPGLALAKA